MKYLMNSIAAALALGYMQEAEAETSTGGSAGDAPRKRGPKVNLLDIARGRMPLAVVAAVRFHVKADIANAQVAKTFGTSVGKIFDIRKGRNFQYVTEDFKPSEQDLKDAEAYAKEAAKHGGDEAVIMAAVDKLGKASPEEAKAQAEKITAQRSKGPRAPRAKKAEGGETAGAATSAEDLLK